MYIQDILIITYRRALKLAFAYKNEIHTTAGIVCMELYTYAVPSFSFLLLVIRIIIALNLRKYINLIQNCWFK